MPLVDVLGLFILFITLWVFAWTAVASIRFILINIFMLSGNFEFDKDLKLKHLLYAQLYDNLLELKVWNPAERIEAVNKRARSYANSENRQQRDGCL